MLGKVWTSLALLAGLASGQFNLTEDDYPRCGQVVLSNSSANACELLEQHCLNKNFGYLNLSLIYEGNGNFWCDYCIRGTVKLDFIEDKVDEQKSDYSWVKWSLLGAGSFALVFILFYNITKQGMSELLGELSDYGAEKASQGTSYIRDHDLYQLCGYAGRFNRLKVILGMVMGYELSVVFSTPEFVPQDAMTCNLSNLTSEEFDNFRYVYEPRQNFYDVMQVFTWQTIYSILRFTTAYIADATENNWDDYFLVVMDLIIIAVCAVGAYLTIKEVSEFLDDSFSKYFYIYFFTWVGFLLVRWIVWLPLMTYMKNWVRSCCCCCLPKPRWKKPRNEEEDAEYYSDGKQVFNANGEVVTDGQQLAVTAQVTPVVDDMDRKL